MLQACLHEERLGFPFLKTEGEKADCSILQEPAAPRAL